MELRTFSKSDWYAFAGASKLADGTGPFIGEFTNAQRQDICVLVSGIDESGSSGSAETVVEVYVDQHNGPGVLDMTQAVMQLTLSNPALAKLVVQAMQPGECTVDNLTKLGFARNA